MLGYKSWNGYAKFSLLLTENFYAEAEAVAPKTAKSS
jgi:hypothetical protein